MANANIHVGNSAKIAIGDQTYCNEGFLISAASEIIIGKKCAISNNVTILDSDFHQIINRGVSTGFIHIGDSVWIGAGATILKNTTIGSNSVIGACSVVTHDIPPNSIAVGIPAKVIGVCDGWK